jgi:hypothetical protein
MVFDTSFVADSFLYDAYKLFNGTISLIEVIQLFPFDAPDYAGRKIPSQIA